MEQFINIPEACRLLNKGEIVSIPTETVYGLAANALDKSAILKIFIAKNRPKFNPIIAHLPTIDRVFQFASDPGCGRLLAEAFWPGPLTLLLPHNNRIPDLLTAGSDLCGFRIPDHPVALEILNLCNFPLAAPSANLSNRRSPTTAQMVLDQLGDRISGVVDGGPCKIGIESSVIQVLDASSVRLLRPGSISVQNLTAIGLHVKCESLENSSVGTVQSPGLLKTHYQPKIPLILLLKNETAIGQIQKIQKKYSWKRICLLGFGNRYPLLQTQSETHESINICDAIEKDLELDLGMKIIKRNLSPGGESEIAARRLFKLFDTMATECDAIIAQLLPGQGLVEAINDRLQRAASFHIQS